MALLKEAKTELIKQYRQHETDSGSPEVQIAVLTNRIISSSTRKIIIPDVACFSWSGVAGVCLTIFVASAMHVIVR
jgi:hypothetical protein